MKTIIFRKLLIFLVIALTGCATPWVQPEGPDIVQPYLSDDHAIMNDGYRLPVTRWVPEGNSRAIVLALHGLNDYSNGFAGTGRFLAERGITVIAYDQRGFGRTAGHGLWHGANRMVRDLRTMANLVQEACPGQPLFILGESMGGAVVLSSLEEDPPAADGIILVGPAVWSRDTMPVYQRLALWFAAHTMPDKPLTGKGLKLHPSDNIEMLRALSRDPLVIKATRVDVLYGISNLMDRAAESAPNVRDRTLILYGLNDDIIPRTPACRFLTRLPEAPARGLELRLYPDGYHMLTRDLQGDAVLEDMAQWIRTGQKADAMQVVGAELSQVCSD